MRLLVRRPLCPSVSTVLVALSLLAGGCSESADEATARRKKEYNIQDQPAAKYSGTVTIDGRPPDIQTGHELLVFLYDSKTDADKGGRGGRYSACQRDGRFQFGETIPPGSYVVLFAELARGRPGVFRGPDLLQNLYNDPDKNATRDGFTVELSPPGKTGASFNLEIAGKEPVSTPGSHAVVRAGTVK
jgi:hypothetical protein